MKKLLYDMSVLGVGFEHVEHRTGVFRVVQETLNTLRDCANINLYLCASEGNNESCEKYLVAFHPDLLQKFIHLKRNRRIKRFLKTFIKQYDYYFTPYNAVHINFRKNIHLRKIIIIYDLIQVKFKQWVRDPSDYMVYSKLLRTLDKNTIALCISEHTKKDLMEWKTKLLVNNIKVVPLGADEKFKPCEDKTRIDIIRKKYKIPQGDYFFSISSMNPRKNFRHTIKCFIKFIEKYNIQNLFFVLSGPEGWGDIFDGIELDKYKEKIIFIGFAADDDLPYLYSGAIASVYLSLYEGFGLPPLESLCCETPVIASNTSSIPEVVGAAGLLIDPESEDQLIEAYNKIYSSEELQNNLVLNAKAQIEKYTWENFTKAITKEI